MEVICLYLSYFSTRNIAPELMPLGFYHNEQKETVKIIGTLVAA